MGRKQEGKMFGIYAQAQFCTFGCILKNERVKHGLGLRHKWLDSDFCVCGFQSILLNDEQSGRNLQSFDCQQSKLKHWLINHGKSESPKSVC